MDFMNGGPGLLFVIPTRLHSGTILPHALLHSGGLVLCQCCVWPGSVSNSCLKLDSFSLSRETWFMFKMCLQRTPKLFNELTYVYIYIYIYISYNNPSLLSPNGCCVHLCHPSYGGCSYTLETWNTFVHSLDASCNLWIQGMGWPMFLKVDGSNSYPFIYVTSYGKLVCQKTKCCRKSYGIAANALNILFVHAHK